VSFVDQKKAINYIRRRIVESGERSPTIDKIQKALEDIDVRKSQKKEYTTSFSRSRSVFYWEQ
jgi:hypothetical protein